MNDANKQSGGFGSSKQGAAANPGKPREIELELVRLLYRQAPEALGGSLIVALILLGFLWQAADHTWLLAWISVLLLVTILRGLLIVAFRRVDITIYNMDRWGALYTAGALFGGICWGSVATLWSPGWPVTHQVLLVIALAGLGAGAISSSAPRLSTFAAFLFPLLLPIAGILLVQKEGAYAGLGLLLLLYPSLLFLIARNYHNTIRESLGYRFNNQSLFDELGKHVEQLQDEVAARQETQAELSALNETLEQRVSGRANELQVLYLVSSILANPANPLEEVFNAILMSVLSSWSDERETCARITFNDECYQTEHYQDGPQKVSAPIIINGETVGAIDIVYPAGGPSDESELFEYGKGSLLEAISQDISSNIEHRLSLEERQSMETLVRERTVELAKTNEQLQQQIGERNQVEERNHLLLESTSDGIYAVDHDGICTVCNPAAAQMLGYDGPTELIGKNVHTLFHHTHPDGSAYPEQECALLHAYEKTIAVDDEVFWRADGTSFPVEYRASPIYRDQEVVGSVVSFTDLTQRRNAEVQLRQAQKLESVGQLAAGIAHEINTPTQFVSDNTRFLQESFADMDRIFETCDQMREAATKGTVPADLLKRIEAIVQEVDVDYLKAEIPLAIEQSLEGLERITRIVRAMKEFSHPGSEEKTPADLNQAIETTIDVSRNEWKYSAELITELDPALPQVPVLAGEFNQVILNLIVNAAHAIADVVGKSGEMGEIRIATRQDGKWAEITISDTGKGVSEAIQKRIFDPFFTTKEVGKGSGQGLAIAWSVIVDKHDGTIEVESEEGKGTTFTIRLPIMQNLVS